MGRGGGDVLASLLGGVSPLARGFVFGCDYGLHRGVAVGRPRGKLVTPEFFFVCSWTVTEVCRFS
jgi:hypothetical protein